MDIRTTDALYFDDLEPGMKFTTGSLSVSAEEIITFAKQFDPQPFHTDEMAAEQSLFKGLAASGWHTASLTMRLMITSGIPMANGSIGAGVEINWPTPTRPGDELHVVMEVQEVIPSASKPDRGIAVVRNRTFNQHGQVVQDMTAKMLSFRRPS